MHARVCLHRLCCSNGSNFGLVDGERLHTEICILVTDRVPQFELGIQMSVRRGGQHASLVDVSARGSIGVPLKAYSDVPRSGSVMSTIQWLLRRCIGRAVHECALLQRSSSSSVARIYIVKQTWRSTFGMHCFGSFREFDARRSCQRQKGRLWPQ
jgi:hypothetical protein